MSRLSPALSVVIPAYNEETRLESTVRSTMDYFQRTERSVEMIIVDDGSRDGTSLVADTLADEFNNIRLIRLAENEGKGYAVRTGVLNTHGRRVLFADADGATPIAECERLEAALDAGADCAIGSRALAAPDVRINARWYRRVIGRTYHVLVQLLTVRGIADTQCGFKMFPRDVARDLFSALHIRGYAFDVELLLLAQHRGLSIAEVPVNWNHQPGSKINLARDSLLMARDLLLIRAMYASDAAHTTPVAKVVS